MPVGKRLIPGENNCERRGNKNLPYCPKCGKEVGENDRFCHSCGAGIMPVERRVEKPLKTKKKPSADVRADLLDKIEVYAKALYYLATCGPFDASKFEKYDEIMRKAGVYFGPERRQEMLSKFRYVLSTKTKEGGIEELRVMLGETLSEGIGAFNKALVIVSPTPEKDAEEVVRILMKYKVKTQR